MAWFDNLGKSVKNAGNKSVDKAKEIRDTSRIALDIKSQENLINKLYTDLGKAYYTEHKKDSDPKYGQILEIKAAYKKIEELQAERDEIKGMIRCPGCGKTVSREAAFCPGCGTKIIIPEPEDPVSGDVLDETGEVVDPAPAADAAAAEDTAAASEADAPAETDDAAREADAPAEAAGETTEA